MDIEQDYIDHNASTPLLLIQVFPDLLESPNGEELSAALFDAYRQGLCEDSHPALMAFAREITIALQHAASRYAARPRDTVLTRIIVPIDINHANPNRLRSRYERMKIARIHRMAGGMAWVNAGRPRADGPVAVDIISYRARRMDVGNVVAACKHIIDGLFCGAITPDDNPDWFALGEIRQVIGAEWKKNEQVEFIVRYTK